MKLRHQNPDNPGMSLLPGQQPPADNPPAPAQPPPAAKRWGPEGKYESEQAWVDATRSSEQEYSRLARENKALQDQLAQAGRLLQDNPPQPTSTPRSAFEELNEIGLPTEALRRAVQEVASEQLQPIVRGMQAENQILETFPEYGEARADVHRFISSDPRLTETFNSLYSGNPLGAMQWAVAMYKVKSGAPVPTTPAGSPGGAALPTPGSGGQLTTPSGMLPEDVPDPNKLNKGLDYHAAYGNPRPFIKERLKGLIPEGHV